MRWAGASIVFQGALHALNPVRKIGDQIAEAIVVHGQAGEKEALVRAGALLEQVGLPARRALTTSRTSSPGGQKQRVMIAMALACTPSIIIADEPTTALDVMVQAQVLRLLKELQNDLGLSMIFITHDLSVLVEVSDKLAIMYAGRIVEEGPANDVFHDRRRTPTRRPSPPRSPRSATTAFRRSPSGLGGDPPDPQQIPSGLRRSIRGARCAFDECPEHRAGARGCRDAGPARRLPACSISPRASAAPDEHGASRSRHVSSATEPTTAGHRGRATSR